MKCRASKMPSIHAFSVGRTNMKIVTALVFVFFGITLSGSPTITVQPRIISQSMVDHFVDGILESDDMTVKMPVLEAAFRDSKEWELGLRKLIEAETWDWAQMYFVEFYWTNVRQNRDEEFISSKIADLRETPDLWKNLHPIDTMMFKTANER